VKSRVPFSELWEGPGEGVDAKNDWKALLFEAKLRPGVTGKTIDGVYTGTDVESEALECTAVGV
jgi:hypothetical protein